MEFQQDRTGRIMFKLFEKDPSHFPGTLRTQVKLLWQCPIKLVLMMLFLLNVSKCPLANVIMLLTLFFFFFSRFTTGFLVGHQTWRAT